MPEEDLAYLLAMTRLEPDEISLDALRGDVREILYIVCSTEFDPMEGPGRPPDWQTVFALDFINRLHLALLNMAVVQHPERFLPAGPPDVSWRDMPKGKGEQIREAWADDRYRGQSAEPCLFYRFAATILWPTEPMSPQVSRRIYEAMGGARTKDLTPLPPRERKGLLTTGRLVKPAAKTELDLFPFRWVDPLPALTE